MTQEFKSGPHNPATGVEAADSGEPVLLHAVYRGRAISVGWATDVELDAIRGPVLHNVRDVLESWFLVAIRDPGGLGTQVHALGWRPKMANTWITSALTSVEQDGNLVATRSGHAYRLACRGEAENAPILLDHLIYTLRTWGCSDFGL